MASKQAGRPRQSILLIAGQPSPHPWSDDSSSSWRRQERTLLCRLPDRLDALLADRLRRRCDRAFRRSTNLRRRHDVLLVAASLQRPPRSSTSRRVRSVLASSLPFLRYGGDLWTIVMALLSIFNLRHPLSQILMLLIADVNKKQPQKGYQNYVKEEF